MKLGVLASWRGTNAKAIFDHVRLGVLRGVEPVALIYSDAEAPVRKIAESYGVEAVYVPHRGMSRSRREGEILQLLRQYGAELVALAGYDYVLSASFIEQYRWRILNIHPSLLPFAGGKGMYGMRVHAEVYRAGVRVTGPTVHLVDESVDGGPILDQWPVYIGDIYSMDLPLEQKLGVLADRVLIYEHRLYSRVIQAVADGRLEIRTERVKAPKVVEEGGRARYVEEEVERRFAVLGIDEAWMRQWRERQRAYVELQLKEWRGSGKPMHLICPHGCLD
ncbi:MAG: phosphoribosylglycinamide formyltransferase [Thermoproteus sp.]|nr:phosphoribosylglycinamide formyltransferase [Thermoproteus sp.]MDT7882701.1 phosphoribosylglycinamide formyltransferase [Thermoproteus sp.]